MLKKVRIQNYKSIQDLTIELGRINVFIGENGCGKTNILEALAMASFPNDNFEIEDLYNKGVRVARPSLTFSSFLGKKQKEEININLEFKIDNKKIEINKKIKSENSDIYSKWLYVDDFKPIGAKKNNPINLYNQLDKRMQEIFNQLDKYKQNKQLFDNSEEVKKLLNESTQIKKYFAKKMTEIDPQYEEKVNKIIIFSEILEDYLIYSLSIKTLRGIYTESRKQPLGVNGEGLDILIANFDKEELNLLMQSCHFISWFKDLHIDKNDKLKFDGYKLGKSNSVIYFRDKFMSKKNNIFSVENSNDGILHILFYFALFISKKTPQFFAVDNIDTSLNPYLCRKLIEELAELSKKRDKQALITTHNPAILDGLNLHDEEQRLFVVSRSDDGFTKVKRIKLKPDAEVDGNRLKMSELWMRNHIGGLPQDF